MLRELGAKSQLMRISSPICALVALAFSLTLLAPAVAGTPAHPTETHRKLHPDAKPVASSRAHSPAPFRGHAKTAQHLAAHSRPGVRTAIHTRQLPAQRSQKLQRVRPGALAAARRRAHAEDAAPRPLQRVHLAMPAPLRGSHESLVHQNEMAEIDGLERILDEADLNDRIAHGSLVPVPVSDTLRINTDLPENRRYCRPWTATFLTDLAQAHSARFTGSPLEVTSAVRTVEYQRRLRHINGNAAAADGDIASPHLTGGTIDIAKQGLTAREIGWLRAWLLPLEQAGKIDVEEEFHQSCFHISVYKSYAEPDAQPDAPEKSPVSATQPSAPSMLALHGR
jgi:hypothetical protein